MVRRSDYRRPEYPGAAESGRRKIALVISVDQRTAYAIWRPGAGRALRAGFHRAGDIVRIGKCDKVAKPRAAGAACDRYITGILRRLTRGVLNVSR